MSEKRKVYIESSVISYFANRRSTNLIVAAYQEITYEWWETEINKFDCFISQFVIDEISQGDDNAAAARLKVIESFPIVELSDEVKELAYHYLSEINIPRKAQLDAFHIAASVVNGMDYILSWNFHHMANVFIKEKIRKLNMSLGYSTPEICTPEELIEEKGENNEK
jgi:hypothetical protein